MKILQINKFYYLRGGSERYVLDFSKILKDKGHKVIPFSMHDSRNERTEYEEYFIDKVRLNKFSIKNIFKIFYNYDAINKLKKLIAEERPDIAHLHNIDYQFSASIIGVLKKYNIPVVQTLHDYKIICPNKKLFSRNEVCAKCQGGKYYNCFLRKCAKDSYLKSLLATLEAYWHGSILKNYQKVDLFIAPSKFLKEVMVKFRIPKEKIEVVYNFVSSAMQNTEKNNQEGENNYLLYYGRLAREKGIDILIDAIKELNGEKLKIVGSGPEYENLKYKIRSLKLENKIKMLGPKYGGELKNLIVNAKAVILPSVWQENMPLSLLEAMALGKIVIASKIGGLPEIINNSENGLLFEPGNVQDLIEKIKMLQKIDVNQIGESAKNRIKSFNGEAHYQKIIEIYTKIKQKQENS